MGRGVATVGDNSIFFDVRDMLFDEEKEWRKWRDRYAD